MVAKRLSSQERSTQIASIAAKLFARKGFNGVTTREIAKKAGVNEAILFRHFPTKKTLYTEIINQKIHVKPESFDLEAARKGDDIEVLRSVARYFMKEIEKDNPFLRLMLYSALEDHELASVFLKERTDLVFGFLLEYVTRRIKQKAFRNIKPAIVFNAFVCMFFHFILAHELFDVPKALRITKEEAIEHFVDIFLNGVKKRSTECHPERSEGSR